MSNSRQGEVDTALPETVQESKANVGDGDCASEVKASAAATAEPPSGPTDAGDALSASETPDAGVDLVVDPVTDAGADLVVDPVTDADAHTTQADTTAVSESAGGDTGGGAGNCDATPEGPEIIRYPRISSSTSHDAYINPSYRVLKPPGGGTSDIFGATDPPVQNSPRRVARNHLQSSVFGPPAANGEVTPRKAGADSYNRLFGPADSRPQSAIKNRLKSNIILSNDESTSPPMDKNSNSPQKDFSTSAVDGFSTKASMPRRNPVTGDGMYFKEIRRSARRRDGNPVTGEGYANEEKQPISNNAAPPANPPTTNGTSHSAPPQRTRVPPGGFSSGLW